MDVFAVSDSRPVQRLAVEFGGLNVNVLAGCIVRHDGKGSARIKFPIQFDDGFFHQRAADDIFSARRIQRINSQCAPDIPRGHLATIVIPAIAFGRVVIMQECDLMHAERGFVLRASHRIKICDVVAGFVAVGVLPQHAGDINQVRSDVGILIKKLIQFF